MGPLSIHTSHCAEYQVGIEITFEIFVPVIQWLNIGMGSHCMIDCLTFRRSDSYNSRLLSDFQELLSDFQELLSLRLPGTASKHSGTNRRRSETIRTIPWTQVADIEEHISRRLPWPSYRLFKNHSQATRTNHMFLGTSHRIPDITGILFRHQVTDIQEWLI